MSSHTRSVPSPTLVAAAILLLLLMMLAVLDAAPAATAEAAPTRPRTTSVAAGDSASCRLPITFPPVRRPLAPCLTGAVAVTELGLDPGELAGAGADLIRRSAPHLHDVLAGWLEEFRRWSGLTPAADLLPYLETDVTVALYPASSGDPLWPLPRPVIVARIADSAAVARFAAQWTRWKAAAVAPVSHGLLGATAIVGDLGDHPVFGLDLDAVVRLPLPAPTVVVLDRLLVLSPSRGAASEAAAALATTAVPTTTVAGL